MDWFERLTGFRETDYAETKARLRIIDGRLRRAATNESFAVGALTLPSLGELRGAAARVQRPGRLRLSIVEGDVRTLHRVPENRNALFQVASQFNMLEMVGPDVTPEDGVAGYAHDRTQGPACAMAAGAATIYRNYFVPVAGEIGQTAERQLDGLAELGDALAQRLGTRREALWAMRNGYALPTRASLDAIAEYLSAADEDTLDDLRGRLRLGKVGIDHGADIIVDDVERRQQVEGDRAGLHAGAFGTRSRPDDDRNACASVHRPSRCAISSSHAPTNESLNAERRDRGHPSPRVRCLRHHPEGFRSGRAPALSRRDEEGCSAGSVLRSEGGDAIKAEQARHPHDFALAERAPDEGSEETVPKSAPEGKRRNRRSSPRGAAAEAS